MMSELSTFVLGWICLAVVLALTCILVICWRLSPHSIDKSLRAFGQQADLSSEIDTPKEVVCIVGAGISGFYAAYKLREHCQVVVVEGSGAPGGNNRSALVASSEVPVQYGCSGWTTSPLLSRLVDDLGLHRQKCKQHVAALVEGRLELKRFDAGFPSSKPHSKTRLFAWARSYTLYQQCRFVLWWAILHFLYYFFPVQNWSAADIMWACNPGIDDIFIPQCGVNVFVDRCDLSKCPGTYFLRYAALYLGRTFFCIKEGNHELVRRLYQTIKSDCTFHFNDAVSTIEGKEGSFYVHLQSGMKVAPIHQVILACQPHQAAKVLPTDSCYDKHREIVSHFDVVVARSAVHRDHTPFEQADDPTLELGVLYDRTLGEKQHHYLHINPAQFYNVENLPEPTFVTVSYDNATPEDVIASDKILSSFQTTLSRAKTGSQKQLSKLVKHLHSCPQGIHVANAAYLGLMWHEDGLTMAQLASKVCITNLQDKSLVSCNDDTVGTEWRGVVDVCDIVDMPSKVNEESPETTTDGSESRSDSGQSSIDTAASHEFV
jgi:predicted NAD/FAD-binding protein